MDEKEEKPGFWEKRYGISIAVATFSLVGALGILALRHFFPNVGI